MLQRIRISIESWEAGNRLAAHVYNTLSDDVALPCHAGHTGPSQSSECTVGTFHSVCVKILRRHSSSLQQVDYGKGIDGELYCCPD